ncbi:MAG: V-type ATPase subunit, partial [Treponema sp.]|nr:V-type ATPase subunit [Treponema sp.]
SSQDSEDKKDAGDITLQTKLDQHYYNFLWKDMLKLPKADREAIKKILSEEISLRNAVLALRMRTYYKMSDPEIREKFIAAEAEDKKAGKTFAADAEEALSMALDQRSAWAEWKWFSFLNPENPQVPWKADPRYFQNAASEHLYHLARFSFRRKPFSLDSIFCFIKLKQFEEDILTSVAEGLAIGMSSRDIFTLLEVET